MTQKSSGGAAHMPRLLTEAEVAEWLHMKVQTLRNWRCNGIGPEFVKISGAVRYDPGKITAFIEAHSKKADYARA